MSNNRNIRFSLREVRRQGGFSMVEIMVGITVSMILMTGVIQLFVGNKQTYRFHEALARIQENGRFSLEMVSNNIRMAGFTGCPLSGTVENVLNNTGAWTGVDWWKNFQTGWPGSLVGYDGTQVHPGVAFDSVHVARRIQDTDAITILGGSGGYSIDPTSVIPTFKLMQLNRPNGGTLGLGNLVIVCNTQNTSLFQVSNTPSATVPVAHAATGNPGNSTAALVSSYVTQSSMVDYAPTAFYVGLSVSGTTRSLYQLQLQVTSTGVASMVAQELLEGVENMQIFYGVGTNGIVTQYLDATNVPSWSYSSTTPSVLSVRIHLLVSSQNENNLVNQPQTYIFPNDTGDSATMGRTVLAADRRLYQVFSTTIGIRNRLQ